MGQFQVNTYSTILNRMINRVVARTDLSDLTDTSSIKQVLAAAAREDDDQFYQMNKLRQILDINLSFGDDLDKLSAIYNNDIISRISSKKATGQVIFSRQGTTGTVTISIGTEIMVPSSGSSSPIKYITTSEGTISAGNQDSNSVDITAKESGTDYNVDPNQITAFSSKPSGVDSVTNPSAITNGLDEESDDELRTRIKLYVKSLSRGTVNALTYAALTTEDSTTGKTVKYATVIEDQSVLGNVTVYIDDGSGTAEELDTAVPGEVLIASAVGGEVDLYTQKKPIKSESGFSVSRTGSSPYGEPTGVLTFGTDYSFNPASGHVKLMQGSFPYGLPAGSSVTIDYQPFKGLIQEAQKIIDGDPNDRSTYPGYRAAGVLVRVLAPTIIQMIFTANITVKSGFSQTFVADKVKAAISDYINSLAIGEDVILSELTERSMAVPGMYDISISVPSENQIILDNQLARILDSNISIS